MATCGFTRSIDIPASRGTRELLADIPMGLVAFVPHWSAKGLGLVMSGTSLRTRPLIRKESP